MTRTTHRPVTRPIGIVLSLALGLTLLIATPRTADAHPSSCMMPQPGATGVVGSLLSIVNVFSSIVDTATVSIRCADKYDEVDVQMTRDWLQAPAPGANAGGNAPLTFAPCVGGMAADFFPCDRVDMMSHVSHEELGTTFVNDIWGWTDRHTSRDYALVGAREGTVIVDISDTKRPEVLGIVPTASTAGNDVWRDIKVYEDHAFIVSEHSNHGVQVFDLTRVRGWDGTYTTFEPDARYTGHGSAHNININEDSGFAYSVGAGPFSSLGQPNSVIVDEPSSAAGQYLASGASFGPPPTQAGLTGSFSVVNDGSANPSQGCGALVGFPAGAIAIADRGTCPFVQKADNAQAAGAAALVVANNVPGQAPFTMGGASDTLTIPSVMVSFEDGATIKAGLPAAGGVLANDPPMQCGNGLHMIDISNPTNPTFAGCDQVNDYIHDTQCVIYEGPDAEFRGREICFSSNGIAYELEGRNFFAITDVTDKANPVTLSRTPYDGSGYSHQGWLTPNQKFFIHGDEGDEQLAGVNTTERVWDVQDLRNPFIHQVFVNDTTSIDHNVYTEGRHAYQSNYTTGLRIYDIGDIARSGMEEVAFFDIYPENDNATFEGGTWSNYSHFRQKNIVAVSSIDRGLFILRPRVRGAN
jgi:hypothetical protein